MQDKLKYGNWIRVRVLLILGLGSLGLAVIGALPLPAFIRIGAEILSVVLFVSFAYPAYAYYMFAPEGGNLQEKIYDLILDKLGDNVNGSVLDIGAGNGILAVRLAQRFIQAEVIGLDYWGKKWEYSRLICEENARRTNVSERVRFVKGDAAALDFPESSFDAVVSTLTFHEVKSVRQKKGLVREALWTLKTGGRFAFVDYFYDRRYYGEPEEFQIFLWSLGLSVLEFEPLDRMLNYPRLLRHPKAFGRVGIIYGIK